MNTKVADRDHRGLKGGREARSVSRYALNVGMIRDNLKKGGGQRKRTVNPEKVNVTTMKEKKRAQSRNKEESKQQDDESLEDGIVKDKESSNAYHTISEVVADKLSTHKIGHVGGITLPIRNLGNTCFMNSTL